MIYNAQRSKTFSLDIHELTSLWMPVRLEADRVLTHPRCPPCRRQGLPRLLRVIRVGLARVGLTRVGVARIGLARIGLGRVGLGLIVVRFVVVRVCVWRHVDEVVLQALCRTDNVGVQEGRRVLLSI